MHESSEQARLAPDAAHRGVERRREAIRSATTRPLLPSGGPRGDPARHPSMRSSAPSVARRGVGSTARSGEIRRGAFEMKGSADRSSCLPADSRLPIVPSPVPALRFEILPNRRLIPRHRFSSGPGNAPSMYAARPNRLKLGRPKRNLCRVSTRPQSHHDPPLPTPLPERIAGGSRKGIGWCSS